MKTNSTKNWMKVAGLTLAIGTFAFTANAQNTTTAVANLGVVKNSDVAGTAVKANGTIRLIDNKGTIKYLQVQNGITAITNTSDDKTGVTTTWQLGGTLTDNTYITTDGKVFGLDGISFATGSAATAGIPTHTSTDPSASTAGWTLLVRDEATGAVQKLLFTDLVKGGKYNDKVSDASKNFTYSGDASIPASIEKISVYRNGVKLLAGVDYTLGASAPYDVIVKNSSVNAGEDYALYVGDRIEIQWVK
ncbi:hypothetical protein [Paludibacter jiangxiensis]|uniref:Uncharacterized protein n=1 Tax=Paludibacter jiangxiensis TaxID=681398 RepID=A0A161LSN1_9BACT|nr:hypothetical protein [Paludibacter jiangxiensis]GAT63800.1 hypothetical protein PJIAN_4342 [Paludibacter jiangxiensis]